MTFGTVLRNTIFGLGFMVSQTALPVNAVERVESPVQRLIAPTELITSATCQAITPNG